jgi:hypothetical protein
MSRINFEDLPLSADEARAARNYFAWSQTKLGQESGLPLAKIKRFESGNYVPDEQFLTDLRAFFEERGYPFSDTPQPGANAKAAGQVFPGGVLGATEENHGEPARQPLKATVHHMRIAMADEQAIGRVLDLIELNEERAAALLAQPIEPAFFGGLTDEARARHGEAMRLLAENGSLFAKLFGRDLVSETKHDAAKGLPSTHSALMAMVFDDTHKAIAGDSAAMARKKNARPARTLAEAIGAS